jgi:hypothetical protein
MHLLEESEDDLNDYDLSDSGSIHTEETINDTFKPEPVKELTFSSQQQLPKHRTRSVSGKQSGDESDISITTKQVSDQLESIQVSKVVESVKMNSDINNFGFSKKRGASSEKRSVRSDRQGKTEIYSQNILRIPIKKQSINKFHTVGYVFINPDNITEIQYYNESVNLLFHILLHVLKGNDVLLSLANTYEAVTRKDVFQVWRNIYEYYVNTSGVSVTNYFYELMYIVPTYDISALIAMLENNRDELRSRNFNIPDNILTCILIKNIKNIKIQDKLNTEFTMTHTKNKLIWDTIIDLARSLDRDNNGMRNLQDKSKPYTSKPKREYIDDSKQALLSINDTKLLIK